MIQLKTDSDFLQLAFRMYDNPHLTEIDEFKADLRRFKHLSNLINRYQLDNGDLKDGLIINHIVIIGNCFTPECAIPMLQYKLPMENIPVLNTFLAYMSWIDSNETPMDSELLAYLLKRDE